MCIRCVTCFRHSTVSVKCTTSCSTLNAVSLFVVDIKWLSNNNRGICATFFRFSFTLTTLNRGTKETLFFRNKLYVPHRKLDLPKKRRNEKRGKIFVTEKLTFDQTQIESCWNNVVGSLLRIIVNIKIHQAQALRLLIWVVQGKITFNYSFQSDQQRAKACRCLINRICGLCRWTELFKLSRSPRGWIRSIVEMLSPRKK